MSTADTDHPHEFIDLGDPGADAAGDGCDCTELCAMGPTCPGGMLAGLPGSGCWRGQDGKEQP